MKSSTNGLLTVLRHDAPAMYTLWCILEWMRDNKQKPTPLELLVAKGEHDLSVLGYCVEERLAALKSGTASDAGESIVSLEHVGFFIFAHALPGTR
jgi:hypothetical protein